MIVRARFAESQMARRNSTSMRIGRTNARRSSRWTAWRIVSSCARFATTNWPAWVCETSSFGSSMPTTASFVRSWSTTPCRSSTTSLTRSFV